MRPASLVVLAAAIALGACAGGQPRGPSDTAIARVLAGAPGEAQPSTIVALELAFARAMRQGGAVEAVREHAATGAVMLGSDGPRPIAANSAYLADAGEWGPRLVVKSCDGSLALAQGRLRDPVGLVGNYVTVWERQGDGAFRWTHGIAGRDDPQPPPRAPIVSGEIVVTALDAVEGLIATCPRDGQIVPPPPPLEAGAANARLSRDGTLRWTWASGPAGATRVIADYYHEGDWVTAIEESLAPPPGP